MSKTIRLVSFRRDAHGNDQIHDIYEFRMSLLKNGLMSTACQRMFIDAIEYGLNISGRDHIEIEMIRDTLDDVP